MIRGAILHLLNEQPLLVDLPALPAAGDTCVLCSNLRTTAGKRPVWADRPEHLFVFPFSQVRFLEVPTADAGTDSDELVRSTGLELAPLEPELELDEDLLRRIRDT